jgi:phosphate transport system permease protein
MTETTKLPDNNLCISGKRKNPRTKTPFAGQITQVLVYTFTAVVGIILLILVGFVALKSSKLFQNTTF